MLMASPSVPVSAHERPSLPREAVLANAPRQSDGFFEVHAVLGTADAEEA